MEARRPAAGNEGGDLRIVEQLALGMAEEMHGRREAAGDGQAVARNALGRPREPREVRLRVLNDRGLAFDHPAPLADRRAWMLLESPRVGAVAVEIELSWCRYTEGGRYTSGGRFVQVVTGALQLGAEGCDRHSA